MLDCRITAKHFRIGIKGNPPFIDVRPRRARVWRVQECAGPRRRTCSTLRWRTTACGRWVRARVRWRDSLSHTARVLSTAWCALAAVDGVINVNIQKMKKGETWACALRGHGEVWAPARCSGCAV